MSENTQSDIMRSSIVQGCTVQGSTKRDNTIQDNSMQDNSMQDNIMQSRDMRGKILWNNRLNSVDRAFRQVRNTDSSIRSRHFMKHLQGMEETQEVMKSFATSENPFLLLRFGLYEYQICYQYLEKLNGIRKAYSGFIREHIRMDAGIIAENDAVLDDYARYVIENLQEADIMAYWRNYPEKNVFAPFYAGHVLHISVNDLYPYPFWHKDRLPDWQLCLKDRKVLSVTSFAESVKKQYDRRKLIWEDADRILPLFDLHVYQSVQTDGGAVDERFASWGEAVDFMEREILQMDFDIALVSCGGYGLPLSIRLKKRGKKVIQWGGCYQLWFGIMGGRWKNDAAIQKYVNEYWVHPSADETPPLAGCVNNSAYW